MSSEKFLIGNIAKLLDLSSETLRHYERQGLISPGHKDENGYRSFTAKDYSFLFFTKYLRALDFSLTDIKDFLDESESAEQIQMLDEQKERIEEEIADLQNKLGKIQKLKETITDYKTNLNKFDMVKMNSFWFVPVRRGEKLCVSKEDVQDNKSIMKQILDVRFTMVADVRKVGDEIESDRTVGLSMDGSFPKPAENAAFYPECTALRLYYKIHPEDSFNTMLRRQGVIEKLESLGYKADRRVIGIMLNQSDGDFGPSGDYCLYIPVDVKSDSIDAV